MGGSASSIVTDTITSLPQSEDASASSDGGGCHVCRNLNYLPAMESGDQAQLGEEMTRLNITESTPAEPGSSNPAWPDDLKPRYPSIPEYVASAKKGCRCCAFLYLLYCIAIRLIKQSSFATVNGWGMGCSDKDIHALVFRANGTLRMRLTNAPTQIPFVREADPIATFVIHAVDAARKWLRDCHDNHPKCHIKPAGFAPSRLIGITGKDISAVPCNPLAPPVHFLFNDKPTLRLVEPDHPVPYMALSYCWGGSRSRWVTTTKSTLASHRQAIPVDSLPQTINDAILFARLLGFEHIWIDALCIVQDDAADWTAQAARMGDVYSSAELVLSANVTSDCTRPTAGYQNFGIAYQICLPLDGTFAALGRVQWNKDLGDPAFPMPEQFTAQDIVILRMAHLHSRIAGANAYKPLEARGWTCQESLLGRRMLSITNFECVWTCDESAACECGFNQTVLENKVVAADVDVTTGAGSDRMWETTLPYRPVQRLRRAHALRAKTEDLPSVEAMQNTWRQLVTDYTQREITVDGDKLVAISGLARIFGQVFDMVTSPREEEGEVKKDSPPAYLAGIWRHSLHSDLLWFAKRYPRQMAMALEIGDDDNGKPTASTTPQFPTQHQRDIANEPFAAAAARQRWLQNRPARPSRYRAPSWSWASSNFCVSWFLDMTKWGIEMNGGDYSTVTTPFLTLVDGRVVADPDAYGAVTSGYIAVRAPLVAARRRSVPLLPKDREIIMAVNFQPTPLSEAATSRSRKSASRSISQTMDMAGYHFVQTESGLIFECFLDDEVDPGPVIHESEYKCLFDGWRQPCDRDGCGCKKGWSEELFWCLRVNRVSVQEESGSSHAQEGWLLLKRSEEKDAYVRIGIGQFGSGMNKFSLFDNSVETVVRII
ncbi:heterokaryon incompatibility protein-domain-containing protein [Lasiosphaeria hispida]|uniref:Heterokaryon incompatibility protein-domain-containing protein n=1 Tax=Lasiosphaeria hispida TaxID=260671 RepID=A0AAJ0MAD2_9PEZI|nr:heterokaryon incompatibility protein-domain-containing protein [Lasiosphaeria hispida]